MCYTNCAPNLRKQKCASALPLPTGPPVPLPDVNDEGLPKFDYGFPQGGLATQPVSPTSQDEAGLDFTPWIAHEST